ncbi:MAG: Ku protein [Trueperaceae bacterium]
MAARAMWRGVIRMGNSSVPVKLYSGLEDQNVHFRLLHESDRVPVKQELINPQSEEIVPFERARRGFVTDDGDLVIFEPEELDSLEPESSRDIDIVSFLPPEEIDHRWYLRPYYLGPDGPPEPYFALITALERSGREGLARWTMRTKEYVGALRLHHGYPMLLTLRYDAQVVPLDTLDAPGGPKLDEKELAMARQLMDMLAASFEPEEYHDEYRKRVLDLIETKARGGTVKTKRPRKQPRYEDLAGALSASLKKERIRA